MSAVVGSFWKSNRALCQCMTALTARETNLSSLEIIILLCQKVNANRNKAFCIVFITHCQMGNLVGPNYAVWTVADVTDRFDNINQIKARRVLVWTDLPRIQQNSRPKSEQKKKEESAKCKYKDWKPLWAKINHIEDNMYYNVSIIHRSYTEKFNVVS